MWQAGNMYSSTGQLKPLIHQPTLDNWQKVTISSRMHSAVSQKQTQRWAWAHRSLFNSEKHSKRGSRLPRLAAVGLTDGVNVQAYTYVGETGPKQCGQRRINGASPKNLHAWPCLLQARPRHAVGNY